MPAKITRRRFLITSAAVVGGTALACAGLGTVRTSQPPVDMPELTLGDSSMPRKILVAYASQAGFTAGVAEEIGRTLAENGAAVDVRPMKSVTDLAPYQAVVAGSAIHGGKWLSDGERFLRQHRTALGQKPLAAFVVCMAMSMDKPEYRAGVPEYLAPARDVTRLAGEGAFAGGVDLSKLPLFPDRLVLKGIIASGTWSEGDHRDWDAIRAWTKEISPRLLA